ncbi:hypothetical protein NKJ40_19260 [Mesorhizobium sp. M0119]|uniref:hypothetical protein n=1 Tax=unclassified Mesorhizobium TaxID=325217 RepID=UPI00333D915C
MQRQNFYFSSRAQVGSIITMKSSANSQIVMRMSSSGIPADKHDQFDIRNDGRLACVEAAADNQRAKSVRY